MNCVTSRVCTAVLLTAAAGLAAPAAAQEVIGGYRAYIGAADLRNSSGAALTQPWQVIRQDRANVHRFGLRQPGDEGDPWFGSGEMRSALESWVRSGGLSGATEAAIMAGNVSIYVEVLGQSGRAGGVRVGLDGPSATGGTSIGGAAAVGGGDLIVSPE